MARIARVVDNCGNTASDQVTVVAAHVLKASDLNGEWRQSVEGLGADWCVTIAGERVVAVDSFCLGGNGAFRE